MKIGQYLAKIWTGALKMLDVKLTDQIAGHEIAGHETTGHKRVRYETGSDAPNV